jgi:23S rRNA (uracil1939-C5)-methyltransferase
MQAFFQEGNVSFGMFRSIKIDGYWEKEFVSWNTCPLHRESIQHTITNLRAKLREKLRPSSKMSLSSPNSEENFAFLERALVGIWFGSPQVVVVSRDPALKEWVQRWNWSEILVPPFDRVWFHFNAQVGRRIFGHHPIEVIFQYQGPEQFQGLQGLQRPQAEIHPIRAFRQVAHTLLLEARDLAVAALLKGGPALVLDLYCGTGELSLLLPTGTGWIGIELSKEAVDYANTLRNVSALRVHFAYVGAVEDRLRDPQVLNRMGEASYSLYLNPPRSGLSEEAREQVLAWVNERPPTVIVYLSCSASSLARDLEAFEGKGYRVRFLQPYDFFPQTEHFETLAVIEWACPLHSF